ncbi:metallopeptidase family protein [Motilibacter deserti]|uniref:Metallopeptidase family protein n=1 Tax=Motilibacter deserti TaxID=2714956 RepID=A0ABX0GQH6_9ACTN|nr:metallopeptidase family protein [Motilibacter deserti]NHC13093.1 metallopeptidase family protein [Motilibacter deserti]
MLSSRRRDRHGRGIRGPLGPPSVPLSRSRAEVFDGLVLDAVEHLERRWEDRMRDIEIGVENVPPVEAPPDSPDPVPLGRAFPRVGDLPPRIVVYRRPLETRALDRRDLADLVQDVVTEQVAELLGVDPATLDPGYGGPAEDD